MPPQVLTQRFDFIHSYSVNSDLALCQLTYDTFGDCIPSMGAISRKMPAFLWNIAKLMAADETFNQFEVYYSIHNPKLNRHDRDKEDHFFDALQIKARYKSGENMFNLVTYVPQDRRRKLMFEMWRRMYKAEVDQTKAKHIPEYLCTRVRPNMRCLIYHEFQTFLGFKRWDNFEYRTPITIAKESYKLVPVRWWTRLKYKLKRISEVPMASAIAWPFNQFTCEVLKCETIHKNDLHK